MFVKNRTIAPKGQSILNNYLHLYRIWLANIFLVMKRETSVMLVLYPQL